MSLLDLIPGTRNYPLAVHRFGVWIQRRFPVDGKFRVVRTGLAILSYAGEYLAIVTRKVQISVRTDIGPGLWLSKYGRIIIGARKIGSNCKIHHNVTVGVGFSTHAFTGSPSIGNNVTIESNSLIYGNIKIGNGVIIKKNTVVTRDVPDMHMVEGYMGRIEKIS